MRLHTICIPKEVGVFPKNSDHQRPLGKCLSALLLKVCQRALPQGFCGIANMASVYGNIKLIRLFLHHQLAFAEYVTHIATELKNARIMDINFTREEGENYDNLKKYNPWSKRMTDLDKVLGQLMNVDLSHVPMDLGE